ncbi:hypothetical protein [Tenacibaculum piscium]|nr:hypothetical protein [Tenacibaculum piscium]
MIVVFLVNEKYVIDWGIFNLKLTFIPNYISYLIFFLTPVLLTLLSLPISKRLDKDDLEKISGKSRIIEIEQANNSFLPSYLGYFFVALSISNNETLIFVFAILFIFTFFSQTLYFNPLFLLFGYHFYNLTTTNKVKIFLITKKILKAPSTINLPTLNRINNFTFIDNEK